MKTIHITNNQIARAKELYLFSELNGSITKGKSNIYGALGEIVFYDYFLNKGMEIDFNSTYDYDMIIKGYKIDVKTKRTTVIPKDNYLCSISSFNIKQICDFYFFCRITEDLKICYLLGYKRKKDFFNIATFNKKDDIDVNGWAFKDDCYNLKISLLNKFN